MKPELFMKEILVSWGWPRKYVSIDKRVAYPDTAADLIFPAEILFWIYFTLHDTIITMKSRTKTFGFRTYRTDLSHPGGLEVARKKFVKTVSYRLRKIIKEETEASAPSRLPNADMETIATRFLKRISAK